MTNNSAFLLVDLVTILFSFVALGYVLYWVRRKIKQNDRLDRD